ncbi:hypothetical protein B0H13DRAFT_1858952 [Mycena leptocephala]|nr:hypothetical protein B0H13DRAFT_1858952 [Mycena leptocephala]
MAIPGTHKGTKGFEVSLRFEIDDIDKVTTYDIACEYFVHLNSRFQEHFPDLVEDVKSMRWGVPSLHVQGHQDSCNYLFGTAYMECVGHFHGETAEHYWPEANQLGPHDTMIIHRGDWSHTKTMRLAVTLANDIALAKARYIAKRNHFIGLTVSFHDRVAAWTDMDRTPSKQGKEAVSVYRDTWKDPTLNARIVPSQRAIYQAMLTQDDNFQSSLTPKSKVARFLNDALKIQDEQRQLHVAIQTHTEHNLESIAKEVLSRRNKVGNMIAAWRQQQKSMTPMLGDKVAAQAAASPVIPLEKEVLYLPSDLTASERLELDVVTLGVEEIRWREGQVFDALRAVQVVVKALTAVRDRKTKNDRQQKDNTRAGEEIRETIKRRDRQMQTYNAARRAMISLDALEDGPNTSYPPLTEGDTFMKSVRQARRVGDSRFTDGLLWRVSGGAGSAGQTETAPTTSAAGGDNTTGLSGTQMNTRKSSDRVQWFRAEAEMQRWQEQKEQKLVELLRTVRSFVKMQHVWTQLADHLPFKRGCFRV